MKKRKLREDHFRLLYDLHRGGTHFWGRGRLLRNLSRMGLAEVFDNRRPVARTRPKGDGWVRTHVLFGEYRARLTRTGHGAMLIAARHGWRAARRRLAWGPEPTIAEGGK